MNPYAQLVMQSATADFSAFAVPFAYGFCGILLVLILRRADGGRADVLRMLALFTWYVAAMGVSYWWLGLMRHPPDAVNYWRWSETIAASGFDGSVTRAVLFRGIANLGVNAFILVEAVVATLLPAGIEVLTALNILLATFAVYFAGRTALLLFDERTKLTTMVLFLAYFAMYWHCLHNLREAIILFFLGAAIWTFFRWRANGRAVDLVVAAVCAGFVVLFRVENSVLMIAFVALYALATCRSALQFLPRATLMILAAGAAVAMAFEVTGGNPLFAINVARQLRVEGGYSLILPELRTFADVAWQWPISLTFFLVPVLPWQIDVGARYVLNYVHSLTALVLLGFALVGAVAAIRRHRERRSIAALVLALFSLASVFGIAEISAESAARHALFWYFGMMVFAAHGVQRVRAGAAHLAAAYGRGAPLPARP